MLPKIIGFDDFSTGTSAEYIKSKGTGQDRQHLTIPATKS